MCSAGTAASTVPAASLRRLDGAGTEAALYEDFGVVAHALRDDAHLSPDVRLSAESTAVRSAASCSSSVADPPSSSIVFRTCGTCLTAFHYRSSQPWHDCRGRRTPRARHRRPVAATLRLLSTACCSGGLDVTRKHGPECLAAISMAIDAKVLLPAVPPFATPRSRATGSAARASASYVWPSFLAWPRHVCSNAVTATAAAAAQPWCT